MVGVRAMLGLLAALVVILLAAWLSPQVWAQPEHMRPDAANKEPK